MFFMRTPSSYHSLLRHFNKLDSKKKYKRAWELCQEFSFLRMIDDPSYTFDVENAKVGILAASAASKAGAFERSYFEARIARAVLNNEIANPTKHRESNFLDEIKQAEKIEKISFDSLNANDRDRISNEWSKIETRLDAYNKINMRLHTKIDFYLGKNAIDKWLLKRKMKKLFLSRDLFGKFES